MVGMLVGKGSYGFLSEHVVMLIDFFAAALIRSTLQTAQVF